MLPPGEAAERIVGAAQNMVSVNRLTIIEQEVSVFDASERRQQNLGNSLLPSPSHSVSVPW